MQPVQPHVAPPASVLPAPQQFRGVANQGMTELMGQSYVSVTSAVPSAQPLAALPVSAPPTDSSQRFEKNLEEITSALVSAFKQLRGRNLRQRGQNGYVSQDI